MTSAKELMAGAVFTSPRERESILRLLDEMQDLEVRKCLAKETAQKVRHPSEDLSGYTLLMWTFRADGGDGWMMKFLGKQPGFFDSVHCVNDRGENLLMVVVRYGCVYDLHELRRLVPGFADGIRQLDVNRRNALMLACMADPEVATFTVEFLLEYTKVAEDIALKDVNDENALMLAIRHGDASLVDLLLTKTRAADYVNRVNARGDNALMMAVDRGDLRMVDLLLTKTRAVDYVGQMNRSDMTVLMKACYFKNNAADIVARLLEHPEIVQTIGWVGMNDQHAPLMAAICSPRAVRLLLDKSPVMDDCLATVDGSGTILFENGIYCHTFEHPCADLLEHLLAVGAGDFLKSYDYRMLSGKWNALRILRHMWYFCPVVPEDLTFLRYVTDPGTLAFWSTRVDAEAFLPYANNELQLSH